MDLNNGFDDYQVLDIIGRGSYGQILLCIKCKSNTLCVLKEVAIGSIENSSYKDAENEIKILAKLNHPYIIKLFESFLLNNCIYISMEYAAHGNLARYMFDRRAFFLPPNEILYIFCQILIGIQYIHEHQIIHRDIKAENIFLTGGNCTIVKIGDFGISKILGNDKTSTVIGTPYYLAPELCENKPYDTKTDVWALGCLLYEMCTHQRAFDATTLAGLICKIISGQYVPINKDIYENSMQELIDSMLVVAPEDRSNVADILKRPYLFPMLCSLQSALTHLYSYN